MIKVENLKKSYRSKAVVDNLSFEVSKGTITGFLGHNGAGKSTTMKMLIGLVGKDSGYIEILGRNYRDIDKPLKEIGVFIDSSAINVEYTAEQHLNIYATALNLPKQSVTDVLANVGLSNVENKKVKEFSLGMKQRLGIATALLGNPKILILDEPFNGLDVEGIHWLRNLLKHLASDGKAIFISSHLMSEMQEVVDRIVVISDGKLIANMAVEEMRERSLSACVKVCCDDISKLHEIIQQRGIDATVDYEKNECYIYKVTLREVGQLAFENGIPIFELTKIQPTLEMLFMEITKS